MLSVLGSILFTGLPSRFRCSAGHKGEGNWGKRMLRDSASPAAWTVHGPGSDTELGWLWQLEAVEPLSSECSLPKDPLHDG